MQDDSPPAPAGARPGTAPLRIERLGPASSDAPLRARGASPRAEVAEIAAVLAPRADAWNALLDRAPSAGPSASPSAFAAYVAHRASADAPPRGWAAFLAWRGDALVGVLPLVCAAGEGFARGRERWSSPHDLHTRAGDAILSPADAATALPALVRAALEAAPAAIEVVLPVVHDASPTAGALAALREVGPVVVEPSGRRSHVRLDGPATADGAEAGHAAFLAGLGASFRRNLRKARNRVARLPGFGFRFLRGADATHADLGSFLAIEASGWKGREGTAIGADPALAAYYAARVRGWSAEGRLEWHVLEAEGRPLAMHLAARVGRRLTLLKIAYDEERAYFAPGNVLFDETVRRAFEAGDVDEIDCMTDMEWHRLWSLPRAPTLSVRAFRPGLAAALRGAVPARARAAAKASPAVARVARALFRREAPTSPPDAAHEPAEGDRGPTRHLLCPIRWPLGGIRTYLLYVYPTLLRAGWRPTFVAPRAHLAALARDVADWPGAEVVGVDDEGGRALGRAVRRRLATGRYDAIHTQGIGAGAIVEAARRSLAGVARGVPHVVVSHDVVPPGRPSGAAERARFAALGLALAGADVLVCVTQDARENLLAHLPALRRLGRRVVVVPHGVRVAAPLPPARAAGARTLRERLGLAPGVALLGFFGRLVEQKGFLPLLDALARVAADPAAPPFALAAVGGEDRLPEYSTAAARSAVADRVHFLPFEPSVGPSLRQVDLVVMPSLWEAAGLLAMEAMVAGTPLLASDCVGLREVVRDTPARTARAGDPVAWASALRAALDAPWTGAARAFASEARRRFDPDRTATATATLLDELARR